MSTFAREIELSLLVNQQGEEILRLRDMVAKLDGQLGKRPCQFDRCMQHAKLRAENEALREALREAIDWNWLDDDRPEDLFQKYFSMSALRGED